MVCSGGSSHISSLRARGKKGQADGLPNQVFHASGMLPFGGMLLRRSSTAALLALSVTFAGCRRIEEPISDRQATPSLPSATAAVAVSPPLAAPIELLRLPSSAYQALIFADDEAIELLTSSAAYRLLPGKAPEQRALDLGFAATVTRKSYVYWSRASIWSESRRAATLGGPTKLAALAAQPQRFVADIARDEFAFLSRSEDDRYAISKLEHGRVKRLYTSPGSIDALTMLGDALYFVERPGNAGWRIARLKLSGGDATFTASKTGRWPRQLEWCEGAGLLRWQPPRRADSVARPAARTHSGQRLHLLTVGGGRERLLLDDGRGLRTAGDGHAATSGGGLAPSDHELSGQFRAARSGHRRRWPGTRSIGGERRLTQRAERSRGPALKSFTAPGGRVAPSDTSSQNGASRCGSGRCWEPPTRSDRRSNPRW